MIYVSAFLLCATLVPSIQAFGSGAKNNMSNPMDSLLSHCTSGSFRPNHANHLPQATAAPYVITVSSPSGQIYRHGQTVSITIEAKPGTTGSGFKGFFLQGDNTEASFSGNIQCQGGQKTTFCGRTGATHTSPAVKNTVVCSWSPPDHQIGKVQFVATIVKDFATFWNGVKSQVILGPDPTAMTYEQKAIQMRQQMMQQFRQGGQGRMNPLGSLTNLLGSFSRGGQSEGNSNSNPFAALPQGRGQANPFASLLNRQGSEISNMWSMFGGGDGAGQGNFIANSRSNNQQSKGETNQLALNNGLGMANLPSQFGQFFATQ